MSDVCLWCGTPIEPSKRPHIERKFCRNAHRTAWRNAAHQRAILDAMKVLHTVSDALVKLETVVRGQQAQMHGLASAKTLTEFAQWLTISAEQESNGSGEAAATQLRIDQHADPVVHADDGRDQIPEAGC